MKTGKGNGLVLDEKYFRRMKSFNGEGVNAVGIESNFPAWVFDLITCLSQADKGLGSVIKKMLSDVGVRKTKPHKWSAREWLEGMGVGELYDKFVRTIFIILSLEQILSHHYMGRIDFIIFLSILSMQYTWR